MSHEIDLETSGSESPTPSRSGRDTDWSYARREAAGAILGGDQKINNLNDDELDALFDDVQRARAVRRGRPESRVNGHDDDDLESERSLPVRDKYMSNGTSDNFSLDTALTLPSTPPQNGIEPAESEDGRLELIRDDMRTQLEKQKEDFEEKIKIAEISSNQNAEELKAEKERMEHALEAARQEFQQQLEQQKESFKNEVRQASMSPSPKKPRITMDGLTELPDDEKAIARAAVNQWRQVGYVRLAEELLRYAATLKEAQIMSQIMDKHVVFQFTVVTEGQDICSSYDLVLSGISGDEDPLLEAAVKPCIAVRVIDYQHTVIHLWSLQKLEQRVRMMRQMRQYLDRPDYLQHFRLENPFVEPALPQFSLVGEANIPLTAVLEARVQDYAVEVYSAYTLEAIGVIKLSLEPSSAQAPPSTLKFNVVMHDLAGFAEREGTDLHGQMYIPGISEEGGATTTQILRDFDEEPVRFESVHSMTLPRNAPKDAVLRVAIYARVTSMHLDKLLSWDEIRESSLKDDKRVTPIAPRLPESEFWTQEEHDVYAKVKILEMSETGEYLAAEIEQHSNLDPGTYQLHQGLQRRIMINIACSSSDALQGTEVKSIKVGTISLIDPAGSVPDQPDSGQQITLKLIQEPKYVEDTSGVKEITVVAQWDSSLHGSSLLDRPTSDRHAVKLSITAEITSFRINTPMTFTMSQVLQIHPRSWYRPQSLFKQLWKTIRIIHYTSHIFSVFLKPASTKRATDVWRMDSHNAYVKGEEILSHWTPRGVSLVRDYIRSLRYRSRIADVEATKIYLRRHHIGQPTPRPQTPTNNGEEASEPLSEHRRLLEKSLRLWTVLSSSNVTADLSASLTFPHRSLDSTDEILPLQQPAKRPPLAAEIHHIQKNPTCLKSSYLLTPNPTAQSWTRHFAELRPPYLHLYAVPSGSETAIINLRNARIDLEPVVSQLISRHDTVSGGGGLSPGGKHVGHGAGKNIWAIYASGGSWLLMAKSEEEKGRWVLAVDEGLLGDAKEGEGQ